MNFNSKTREERKELLIMKKLLNTKWALKGFQNIAIVEIF